MESCKVKDGIRVSLRENIATSGVFDTFVSVPNEYIKYDLEYRFWSRHVGHRGRTWSCLLVERSFMCHSGQRYGFSFEVIIFMKFQSPVSPVTCHAFDLN